MNEGNAGEALEDAPVFQALLTPHRSLGRGGFLVLVAVTAALCLAHGVVFIAAGAWPIFAFFGLDILLLYGAFWLNYRDGRAREEVSVSRSRLSIRKFAPSGRMAEDSYNPFWARFSVARHSEIGITRMQVVGEGRQTEIGSFLNPDDREGFAAAFSGALARVKAR